MKLVQTGHILAQTATLKYASIQSKHNYFSPFYILPYTINSGVDDKADLHNNSYVLAMQEWHLTAHVKSECFSLLGQSLNRVGAPKKPVIFSVRGRAIKPSVPIKLGKYSGCGFVSTSAGNSAICRACPEVACIAYNVFVSKVENES